MHSLVSSMCHLCGVCRVCCMSLNSPVSLRVWLPVVSLVVLHSPLFLFPHSCIDGRALCEAALSLKKLHLSVQNSGTHEALTRIFDLQTLEELVLCFLHLYSDTEVSSACSLGMYVRTYVCLSGVDSEGPVYLNTLYGFLPISAATFYT